MKAATFLLFASVAAAQVMNPLVPHGADPWIVREGHTYYLTTTPGKDLKIRKSDTLAGLATAPLVTVWHTPAEGMYSKQVWAPELHHIDGKWYLYFAASDGDNHNHRIYVIENSDKDPTTQNWVFKGKLNTPDDSWAIDLTTFEYRHKRYAVWAGWPGTDNGVQNLYIARMKNPWTFATDRVLISTPTFPWEKIGNLGKPDGKAKHLDVNEGPEALEHDGHLFLVYSASACWTDHYALGMLSLKDGGDPIHAKDWKKSDKPVFTSSPEAHAYGTGHNGFFTSPDGKENWIVYHANPEPNQGCKNQRSTRVQPFTWNTDGTPNFGRPAPLGKTIPSPSGEESKQ